MYYWCKSELILMYICIDSKFLMIFLSPSDPFVDSAANYIHWAVLEKVLQGEPEDDFHLGVGRHFGQLDGLSLMDLALVELSPEQERQSSDGPGILGAGSHHHGGR